MALALVEHKFTLTSIASLATTAKIQNHLTCELGTRELNMVAGVVYLVTKIPRLIRINKGDKESKIRMCFSQTTPHGRLSKAELTHLEKVRHAVRKPSRHLLLEMRYIRETTNQGKTQGTKAMLRTRARYGQHKLVTLVHLHWHETKHSRDLETMWRNDPKFLGKHKLRATISESHYQQEHFVSHLCITSFFSMLDRWFLISMNQLKRMPTEVIELERT